jgi:hypothetical protein
MALGYFFYASLSEQYRLLMLFWCSRKKRATSLRKLKFYNLEKNNNFLQGTLSIFRKNIFAPGNCDKKLTDHNKQLTRGNVFRVNS